MRKILRNENGASSVLVIFMMILLVSIGTFALMSSNANYKFSNKPLEWNADYYEMDDKAEQYIMDLDILLSDAESKTIEYFLNGGNASVNLDAQTLNAVLNKVYFGFLEKNLPELLEKYPESSSSVFAGEDDFFADAAINFISDTEQESNLNLYLLILPLKYQLTPADSNLRSNVLLFREPGFKRYAISNWNQWQLPRQSDQTHDVWIPE